MSIDLIYTNSSGRFNDTECKRLSDLSGCSLPEKEFTESEYEMIFDLHGYVGMDIPWNMGLLAPWVSNYSGLLIFCVNISLLVSSERPSFEKSTSSWPKRWTMCSWMLVFRVSFRYLIWSKAKYLAFCFRRAYTR